MIAFQNVDPKKPIENGIHLLPCKIDKDGQANVDLYFEPLIQTEKGLKNLNKLFMNILTH